MPRGKHAVLGKVHPCFTDLNVVQLSHALVYSSANISLPDQSESAVHWLLSAHMRPEVLPTGVTPSVLHHSESPLQIFLRGCSQTFAALVFKS